MTQGPQYTLNNPTKIMTDLLKQLQALIPLAKAATQGPWTSDKGAMVSAPAALIAAFYTNTQLDGKQNAALTAAARNLLTPENLLALCAALAPQWVAMDWHGGPCDPMLEEEFLYVELSNGKIVQAMYTECNYQPEHTEIGESYAWGHYTEVDHMEPLPVQPVRYFTPPTTTEGAQPNV